jgi:hypothetical protein
VLFGSFFIRYSLSFIRQSLLFLRHFRASALPKVFGEATLLA